MKHLSYRLAAALMALAMLFALIPVPPAQAAGETLHFTGYLYGLDYGSKVTITIHGNGTAGTLGPSCRVRVWRAIRAAPNQEREQSKGGSEQNASHHEVLAAGGSNHGSSALVEPARQNSLFFGQSIVMREPCMIDAGRLKVSAEVIPRNAKWPRHLRVSRLTPIRHQD